MRERVTRIWTAAAVQGRATFLTRCLEVARLKHIYG